MTHIGLTQTVMSSRSHSDRPQSSLVHTVECSTSRAPCKKSSCLGQFQMTTVVFTCVTFMQCCHSLHEQQHSVGSHTSRMQYLHNQELSSGQGIHLEGLVDCLPVVCKPREPLMPLDLALTWSVEGALGFGRLSFGLTIGCKLVLSDKVEEAFMSPRLLLPGCALSDSQALWYFALHAHPKGLMA